MIPAPFSDWRAAIGTTFIIDLWFSGIILTALIVSFLRKSRTPAIFGLAGLAAYVGFQYALKEQATEFARRHAAAQAMNEVHVEPRPVSPFNWMVFASDHDKYDMANVNLIRRAPVSWRPGESFIRQLDSAYQPLGSALWITRYRYGTQDPERAREAWNSDAMAVFRWFAVVPAFDGKEGDCYYFVDLRFATPGRGSTPFRFGACGEDPQLRLSQNARG